ncbi:helix-turn-helix domain-containing protein [Eubacterium callanderi]|uniref:helix-turn-helix domain-containing protein n=1 Tax=Eubacterium callanderi TaxID=53442 RepID=UPI001FB794E8|nr:helix-turn-helix transcriptional regulator [Eubacterium callanderi]MBO1701076.1 helix-turn-helix transcriptional regulator [Eubacterium callanderi]
MANFSEMLKNLRKERGLTQEALAKALSIGDFKISPSAVGMWEQGRREPDFETLDLIADFFNVDIDFLLGKTDKTTYIPNPNKRKDESYAKNETEKKLLVLCRKANDVSEEEREDIINLFENTIDLYLKAKGIKGDE